MIMKPTKATATRANHGRADQPVARTARGVSARNSWSDNDPRYRCSTLLTLLEITRHRRIFKAAHQPPLRVLAQGGFHPDGEPVLFDRVDPHELVGVDRAGARRPEAVGRGLSRQTAAVGPHDELDRRRLLHPDVRPVHRRLAQHEDAGHHHDSDDDPAQDSRGWSWGPGGARTRSCSVQGTGRRAWAPGRDGRAGRGTAPSGPPRGARAPLRCDGPVADRRCARCSGTTRARRARPGPT